MTPRSKAARAASAALLPPPEFFATPALQATTLTLAVLRAMPAIANLPTLSFAPMMLLFSAQTTLPRY